MLLTESPHKEISSVCMTHTRGCKFCISRKLAPSLSIKMQEYESENLVSKVVPEIYYSISLLKSKKLFFYHELCHLNQGFHRNKFFVLLI